MPGSILNADINFPHFTGNESTDEKIESIQSYLFMLYEQLRYSMANIGKENFNETELNDIISIAASKIDVSGMVTFHDLETAGQTVINGANLMTGTVVADDIVAGVSISSPTIIGGTIRGVTFESYDSSASLTMQGGAGEGMGIFVDNNYNLENIFKVVQESMGHGTTTDAYIQGVEFAWTDGYGIHFTGEDISVSDAYVSNVVAGSGSFNVHTYGANSAYWEFDNSGIYFCAADGTRVSQVVLQTI